MVNLKIIVTEEELNYRKEEYPNPHIVIKEAIFCTACGVNVNKLVKNKKLLKHPHLDVIVCKRCTDFYGDGNFSADEDGDDKYCRWCGQGGKLYLCSDCTVAFCKGCIKRNLPKTILRRIQQDDWRCFVCDSSPLWRLRAICNAVQECMFTGKRQENGVADSAISHSSGDSSDGNSSNDDKRCKGGRKPLPIPASVKSEKNMKNKTGTKSTSEVISLDNDSNRGNDVLSTVGLTKCYSNWNQHQKEQFNENTTNNVDDLIELCDLMKTKGEALKSNYLGKRDINVSLIIQNAQSLYNDMICNVQKLQDSFSSHVKMCDSLHEQGKTGKIVQFPTEVDNYAEPLASSSPYNGRATPLNNSASSSSVSSNMAVKDKPSNRNSVSSLESAEDDDEELKSRDINGLAALMLDYKSSKSSSDDEAEDNQLNASDDVNNTATENMNGISDNNGADKEESDVSDMPFSDSSNKKTSKKRGDQETEEINRLTSLSGLNRSRQKSNSSSGAEDEGNNGGDNKSDHDSEVIDRKEKKPTEVDSILNYLDSNNPPLNDENDSSDIEISNVLGSNKRNSVLTPSDVSKMLLARLDDTDISDSDENANTVEDGNDTAVSEKSEKSATSTPKNSDENDSDDDEENDTPKRKKTPNQKRRDKLLCGRLSDTSEEERYIKRSAEKQNEMNKSGRNSSSEDSDNVFLRKRNKTLKRRRMKFWSSSSSVSSSHSKSDDSDEKYEPEKKDKAKKRKRIKRIYTDSSSNKSEEEDGQDVNSSQLSSGKSRKKIRKVMSGQDLTEDTKVTLKIEEERKKRIAERQQLYNKSFTLTPTDKPNLDKLILDFDDDTKEPIISVHPDLIKKLKPHQAAGVKFMWDVCFESVKRIETEPGSGGILAHCMGLGKTLQVVALVHTLLTHELTKVKNVLVVCPLSTVLNWVNEFEIWLKDINDGDDVEVFHLTKMHTIVQRAYRLREWHEQGGVCVIGYEMFRSLVNVGKKTKLRIREMINDALLDTGPDLVVCDEGHMLKNEKTALSKAMVKIKTARRIVLTGTPIQNNLKEYHCMVQFVKPNLLGDRKEFNNRFVNPIVNGQFVDSSLHDVRLMKRRAHVLHKMLDGIVQRRDYNVLTPFLPPKHEYVILVRLSKVQADLYEYYLNDCVRTGGSTLFQNYQILRLIWTHPYVLKIAQEKKEEREAARQLSDEDDGFVVDNSDDEDDGSGSSSSDSDEKSRSGSDSSNHSGKSIEIIFDKNKTEKNVAKKSRLTRNKAKETGINIENEIAENQENEKSYWWSKFVTEEDFDNVKNSSKLVLLFTILQQCEMIGDKVLLFSQSIPSLDMIEYFLNKEECGSWSLGADYFRLDGSTSPENRAYFCKNFNKPENTRARLFLISTRAGGLGINLTAANRVVIFDASWNPSHDVQSIFRIFRFGQDKPCYVYRLISKCTMEEKIYERQVTKQSISCRVVDEQQIDRHFNSMDLQELYMFDRDPSIPTETPTLPKDRLMADMLQDHPDIIVSHHEHDSLLENIVDETLTDEERQQAWKDYEQERVGLPLPAANVVPAWMMAGINLPGIDTSSSSSSGSVPRPMLIPGVPGPSNLYGGLVGPRFGGVWPAPNTSQEPRSGNIGRNASMYTRLPSKGVVNRNDDVKNQIMIPAFDSIRNTVKVQNKNASEPDLVPLIGAIIDKIAKNCNEHFIQRLESVRNNASLTEHAKYVETLNLNYMRDDSYRKIRGLQNGLHAFQQSLKK